MNGCRTARRCRGDSRSGCSGLSDGERTHTPAGVQPRPHQVLDDRLRLGLVDDAAPEQEAIVRCQRVHLRTVGIEREREVAAIGQPEIVVESTLEVGASCSSRSAKAGSFQTAVPTGRRAAWRRRRTPAARRSPGEAGSRPSLNEIEFQESFQDWFSSPGLLVPALVRDVAVAHEVGELVDPVECGASLVLQVADELPVAGPRSYSSRRTTYSGVASTEP